MAALLGQKKIKKADVCWLYACHVDHSSFRGRYEIVVSQLSEMSTGRCACRTRRSITTSSCECSGASDCGCRPYGGATRCRQRFSSQNNETVNFSTNQRAAYDSPCFILAFFGSWAPALQSGTLCISEVIFNSDTLLVPLRHRLLCVPLAGVGKALFLSYSSRVSYHRCPLKSCWKSRSQS